MGVQMPHSKKTKYVGAVITAADTRNAGVGRQETRRCKASRLLSFGIVGVVGVVGVSKALA